MGILSILGIPLIRRMSFMLRSRTFDESMPIYQNMVSKYYKALVNSKFRKELEKI